jgi:hypothetical protein
MTHLIRSKTEAERFGGIVNQRIGTAKKSIPNMAEKGPPFSNLKSLNKEKEINLTRSLTPLVTWQHCPSANAHVTENAVKGHGSFIR